jgi:hypothetical protein
LGFSEDNAEISPYETFDVIPELQNLLITCRRDLVDIVDMGCFHGCHKEVVEVTQASKHLLELAFVDERPLQSLGLHGNLPQIPAGATELCAQLQHMSSNNRRLVWESCWPRRSCSATLRRIPEKLLDLCSRLSKIVPVNLLGITDLLILSVLLSEACHQLLDLSKDGNENSAVDIESADKRAILIQ